MKNLFPHTSPQHPTNHNNIPPLPPDDTHPTYPPPAPPPSSHIISSSSPHSSTTTQPPPPPPPPPPKNPPPNPTTRKSSPAALPPPTSDTTSRKYSVTNYRRARDQFHQTLDPTLTNDDGYGAFGVLQQGVYQAGRSSTGGVGVYQLASHPQGGAVAGRYRRFNEWAPRGGGGGGGGGNGGNVGGLSGPRRRTANYAPPGERSGGGDNVGGYFPPSYGVEWGDGQSVAGMDAGSDISVSTRGNSSIQKSATLESTDDDDTPIREPEMPDATYEENYGDAYIGAPIRYIYPSGYQNMRPRSGPWKLSIIIFGLFTWLSIFIIGHCSDQIKSSEYDVSEIDDDALKIETRWCGSHTLYFLWTVSIIVTGLATGYCSIIGYIKLRDFAVANCRSQPPGMVGKSDYYVKIDDGPAENKKKNDVNQRTIYQADGTPQFWGGFIYRPTQAAVAVTSR